MAMIRKNFLHLFLISLGIFFLLVVVAPVARAGFWDKLSDDWRRGDSVGDSITGRGSLFGRPADPVDRGAWEDILGAVGAVGGEAFSQRLVDTVNGQPEYIQVVLGRVIGIFFSLAGTVFLVVMIYGGFQWMTAQGNSEQVDAAKNLIIRSIIGMGIVFAAFALTYTIAYIYFRVTSPPHVQTFIAPQQDSSTLRN